MSARVVVGAGYGGGVLRGEHVGWVRGRVSGAGPFVASVVVGIWARVVRLDGARRGRGSGVLRCGRERRAVLKVEVLEGGEAKIRLHRGMGVVGGGGVGRGHGRGILRDLGPRRGTRSESYLVICIAR